MDSIKYGLIFSRFFNAGRKNSLPDIDTDFPTHSRQDIIQYIFKKYTTKNAMHIATYQTLMGRAAIKAVFRAHPELSFEEVNNITKNIVDKAKISDELQLVKDAGEEPSVIKWCLENKSEALSEWCTIDKDDKLDGPLAKRFDQAIRLEGVICAASKHAAGICLSKEPINTVCPIIYDAKENQQIIGCQFTELEYIGLTKIDVLGLSALDKLEGINDLE